MTLVRLENDRLGWRRDGDGRLLRTVTVAPVERPTPSTLARLEQTIRASWSAETSDRPDEWSEANPAFQQCDVTARVVRDYLGGEILVAGVVLDGRRVDMHAWNRLPRERLGAESVSDRL
jgi:hypothetical protein